MTYDVLGPVALDYMPCTYGMSKLSFRGPKRDLDAPYVAFLGGAQTFGKFIEQPFALRVEHLTGVPSVNFGQTGAGVDVFARERDLLAHARGARAVVLEVLGAANMSNLFYTVHPRRNDRFVRASAQLRALYPEVDFTQFNFVQHLLRHLAMTDPLRFGQVEQGLRRAWMRRMGHILPKLGDALVLVHITGAEACEVAGPAGPAFVTPEMLAALRDRVPEFIEVAAQPETLRSIERGMVFGAYEEAAAHALVGPRTHEAIAQALLPALDRLMR